MSKSCLRVLSIFASGYLKSLGCSFKIYLRFNHKKFCLWKNCLNMQWEFRNLLEISYPRIEFEKSDNIFIYFVLLEHFFYKREKYTILTASVWTGWVANNNPDRVAKGGLNPATVRLIFVNSRQAIIWSMTFIRWNHTGWSPTMR